jgi:hypothetical protein
MRLVEDIVTVGDCRVVVLILGLTRPMAGQRNQEAQERLSNALFL